MPEIIRTHVSTTITVFDEKDLAAVLPNGVQIIHRPHFLVFTDNGDVVTNLRGFPRRPTRVLSAVSNIPAQNVRADGTDLREVLTEFFREPLSAGRRVYVLSVKLHTSELVCQTRIRYALFTPEAKKAPVEKTTEPTLNITECGYYRTRHGAKVRVVCVDGDVERPVRPVLAITGDGLVTSYTRDGYNDACKTRSSEDIVSKWVEKPVVQWKYMPAWAEYTAKDEKGAWHWYAKKPNVGAHEWLHTGGSPYTPAYGPIPPNFAPTFTGDWKASLVERPNDEPAI